MKDWISNFLENHQWVKTVLFLIGIYATMFFINFISNAIQEKLDVRKELKFQLVRGILFAISIPVIGLYLWYNYSETPLNEFRLITDSKIANGHLTNVESDSEYVETNDGRSGGMAYFYFYEYKFTLPTGQEYSSGGKEDGDIPEKLKTVAKEPFPVEVEYLENNPNVNRVKGMPSNTSTLYEFFRFTILKGLVVLSICLYISIKIIKSRLNTYRKGLFNLTS